MVVKAAVIVVKEEEEGSRCVSLVFLGANASRGGASFHGLDVGVALAGAK